MKTFALSCLISTEKTEATAKGEDTHPVIYDLLTNEMLPSQL